MRKPMKILWAAIAIAFVVGLILMAAGYFAGAGMSLYVDDSGIHVAGRAMSSMTVEEPDLHDFDTVKIDADYADIRIIGSDKNKIEFNYAGKKPEFQVIGGTLTITQRHGKNTNWITWGIGGGNKDEIIFYCKSDEVLKGVSIVMEAGLLRCSGMKADEMDCANNYGDAGFDSIEIGELTVKMNAGNLSLNNSTVKNFNAENALGDIGLDDVTAPDLKIRVNAGKVTASGDFGNMEIQGDLGDISVSTSNGIEEYRYDLRANLGSVKIDGDSFGSAAAGGDGAYNLKLSANTGSIDVKFGE